MGWITGDVNNSNGIPVKKSNVKYINSNYTLDMEDDVIIISNATDHVLLTLFNSELVADTLVMNQYLIINNSDYVVKIITHNSSPFLNGIPSLSIFGKSSGRVTLGVTNNAESNSSGWVNVDRQVCSNTVARVNTWADSNFKSETFVPIPMDTPSIYINNDVVSWDSINAPTKITVNADCLLNIRYSISFNSSGGSAYNAYARISSNGGNGEIGTKSISGNYGNEDCYLSLSANVYMNKGDYIELETRVTNGFAGAIIESTLSVNTTV